MDYKELIKSFTEKDYENGVNLHIHTTCSDGKATPEEIVNQTKNKGYTYIAISDHNTVEAHKISEIANENCVIPAVEFDCWYKTTFFHLLAYGIDVDSEELKPFLAKTKKETELDIVRIFSKRDIKKLIPAIHNAGGIAILAHPACCWCVSLDKFVKQLMEFGLDGLECFYPYDRHRGIIKFHSRKSVEIIADKYNLIKTGGTDCHSEDLH